MGSCADCLCWTGLLGGRCKPCRLFRFRRDLGDCPSCGRRVPLGAAGRCRLCLAISRATGLIGYGQARGWSPDHLQRIRRSLAALLAAQPPLASTVPPDAAAVRQFLLDRHLTALRVVEFLTDQGLVASNQHAGFDRWLAGRLEPLPAQIRAEVQAWVEVLCGRGPRAGRPRKPATIQGYLRALESALADWSARYQSLRQVTTHDITDQLRRHTGPTRRLVLAVMRSLFKTLKTQRVVFTNPTAGLELRREPPPPVLGLDPARRAGLLDQLDRPTSG